MGLIYLYFVLALLVAVIAKIRGRAGWAWFLVALFMSPLIAGLLVLALPRQRAGQWYARWDEHALPPGVVPMPADSTIRIIRRAGLADEARPCEIFVNGAAVGIVEPDSALDFPVPSGLLTVEARIEWADSRPLTIKTAPGQRVDLELSRRGGPWLALWARAFPTENYLALTQRAFTPAAQTA